LDLWSAFTVAQVATRSDSTFEKGRSMKINSPHLFVAFEESTSQIVANAATFGWDAPPLAKKKLFFLDAQLSPDVVKAGEFDLVGMLNVVQRFLR
jgi:KaiC/GvpD/RAD55 family RecA-like ATPase